MSELQRKAKEEEEEEEENLTTGGYMPARSYGSIRSGFGQIADVLKRKSVTLKVLDQSTDTATPEGKLMFSLLGAFAKFEYDIRSERQADGVAKAKSMGVKFGRKRALSNEQIERIHVLRNEDKLSIPDIAKWFNSSVATVYRSLITPSVRA